MNNFSPRAQQVLALARKEAGRLNHEAVGSGHLLLGIIRLHQGVAVDVLSQMIVGDLVPLQKETEKQLGAGSTKTVDVPIPYDAGVKRVLVQAGKQAKFLNHAYVGTEHLLMGMLIEEGMVKKVLESFGVTHEQARIRALKELDPNISPERLETSGTPLLPILREITSDAIRYWERCRVVYNIVLAVIVMTIFFRGLPLPWESMSGEGILGLFVLAVAANVLFCAAYLPDLLVQFSVYRDFWRQWRWLLFVLGLTFAGIVTRWMTMDLFRIQHR